MEPVKFLFITICFNNLDGLKRTVNSLLEQSYLNWKAVIIDGDSEDGTKEYLSELKRDCHDQFEVVSEPDEGIYDAMNKGISRVRSENYFCFLNSGDSLYDASVLSNVKLQLDSLKRMPVIFYGNTCETFPSGREVLKIARSGDSVCLEKGMFCHHQAMFFHNSLSRFLYSNYKLSGDYDYVARSVTSLNDESDLLFLNLIIARFDMSGVSNQRRFMGILEDYHLRVKNKLCSPSMSMLYTSRSFVLMAVKYLSYPVYIKLRSISVISKT